MADRYIKFERELSGPNEVFAPDGAVYPHYGPVLEEMERMGAGERNRREKRAHERMLEEQRGLEIADDEGVYPFIPDMIRRYLGEEPILQNVETFSLAVEDEHRYVMDHFDELVIKSRSGWGGKRVLIAPEESREDIESSKNSSKRTLSSTSPRDPSSSLSTSSVGSGTENSSCATPTPITEYTPSPRRAHRRG